MRSLCHLFLGAVLLFAAVPTALAQAGRAAAQAFVIEDPSRDVGAIPSGKLYMTDFVIRNTGHVPLIVTRIRTNCGCLVAEQPKNPIMPGQQAVIKVGYNAGMTGPFRQQMVLSTNVDANDVLLTLRGTVVSRS